MTLALILQANITQCVPKYDLRQISETSESFAFPFEDFVFSNNKIFYTIAVLSYLLTV